MKEYHGVTFGKRLSKTALIYDVTAVNGKRKHNKGCKIFVGRSKSEVISEYTIAKQCYTKDEQHFMKVYDLIPFTIQDNVFDGVKKVCYAMFVSNDQYAEQFLQIINKLSEFSPGKRYQTADELLKDLSDFPVKEGIRFYSICSEEVNDNVS